MDSGADDKWLSHSLFKGQGLFLNPELAVLPISGRHLVLTIPHPQLSCAGIVGKLPHLPGF